MPPGVPLGISLEFQPGISRGVPSGNFLGVASEITLQEFLQGFFLPRQYKVV